jgi:hypothetical protein
MKRLLLVSFFLTRVSFAVQAQNGTVTGQLRDLYGNPVGGVRVAATEAASFDSPQPSPVLSAIAQTDESGRYRLQNLPPGRYYIVAGLIDYPTYYPGVTGSSEAKPVEIRTGKVLDGIDFAMSRPTSVKVSGRVRGLKAPTSLPVAMFGAQGAPLQTQIQADGFFEFDKVPLGSYTIRGPGLIPVNIVVDGKEVHVELTPLYSGPGVKVSGAVTSPAGGLQSGIQRTVTLNPVAINPVTGSILAPIGTFEGTTGRTLETAVQPDGSFTFTAVPAGPYLLRVQPFAPGVPSLRVDIANQDLRDLEIAVPFQFDISGRVLLEGRNIGSNAIIEATQSNFTTASSVLPDGNFRLRLTEGANRISLARLPPEFAVESIKYGHKDITHTALNIDRTTVAQEILVTLETIPMELIPGVKVSGRAIGPGRQSVIGLSVSLSPLDSEGTPAETTVASDGSFEFPKVRKGSYMLRFAAPVAVLSKVAVGDKDVSDVEITIGERVEVAGKLSVVDVQGKTFPILPANLAVHFRGVGGGSGETTIGRDGTFRMILPQDRYTVSLSNLPAPYSVKSVASGAVNLLKESLRIETRNTPPQVEVVLEYNLAR